MHSQCVFNLVRLVDKCKTQGVCDFEYAILWRWQWLEMRNKLAELALEWKCDYLFVLDPDLLYSEDVLQRLLAHDKEIVSALCFKSFGVQVFPEMFKSVERDGRSIFDRLVQYPRGLIEVEAIGFRMVLIKTDVFRRMEKPWFAVGPEPGSEVVFFCQKARQYGFKIFVDTNMPVDFMYSNPVLVTEETFRKGTLQF
jgi:hypothetical protein